MRWPRLLRRTGLVLAALTTTVGVVYSIALWQVWQLPVDDGRGADAAVVLGGYTTHGAPSADYAQRIARGVELYRQGRVHVLIFSGCATPGEPITTAAAGRTLALQLGVPGDCILVEPDSRTTLENLAFVKELAQTEAPHLQRLLIVSTDLHLARAQRMATDLHLRAKSVPSASTALGDAATRRAFARHEAWLYLKYLCYSQFRRLPTREDARLGRHRVG